MAPLTDYERERTRSWLRDLRGGRSQEAFAADVTSATGWRITRDRYSKYESGAVPMGRDVLAHFLRYAEAGGLPGPDLAPEREPVPLDPYEVIDRLSATLDGLTAELREARLERTAQATEVDKLRQVVRALARRAIEADPTLRIPPELVGPSPT